MFHVIKRILYKIAYFIDKDLKFEIYMTVCAVLACGGFVYLPNENPALRLLAIKFYGLSFILLIIKFLAMVYRFEYSKRNEKVNGYVSNRSEATEDRLQRLRHSKRTKINK